MKIYQAISWANSHLFPSRLLWMYLVVVGAARVWVHGLPPKSAWFTLLFEHWKSWRFFYSVLSEKTHCLNAGEEYERYVSALLVEDDSVKRLLNDLSSNCCTIRANQMKRFLGPIFAWTMKRSTLCSSASRCKWRKEIVGADTFCAVSAHRGTFTVSIHIHWKFHDSPATTS